MILKGREIKMKGPELKFAVRQTLANALKHCTMTGNLWVSCRPSVLCLLLIFGVFDSVTVARSGQAQPNEPAANPARPRPRLSDICNVKPAFSMRMIRLSFQRATNSMTS